MSNIQLIKGDCLEVMKNIPNGSIDAIITDPPYGTTACKWDSVIFFNLMWEQLNRIIKPNGAIVLFATQPFTSTLTLSNINNFRHQWQWIKNRPTGAFSAKYMPMKSNEDILVFGLNKVNYYPIMVKRTEKEFKESYRKNDSKSWGNNIQNQKGNLIIRKSKEEQWFKYPTNILNISKDDKRNGKQHPTQKPVELIEYIIKTYTQENETVLDFTMGSGTTGIACKNLNRKFIGIEMDDKYFDIAKNRIEKHNPQQQLFTI
jgi:site-specific DNA-methyltransferase (adenine-specific)